MPQTSALALLRLVPLFQGGRDEVLAGLADHARFHAYRRGDHLFRAGDPADAVQIVAQGSVRVYRLGRSGAREFTLGIEGPRQVVEAAAVLSAQPTHTANADALQTPTEVLALPADLVRATVTRTPALAGQVIAHLARREAALQRRLDALVFTGVGERLAAHLLEQLTPHALPTNSELAALLGTVPEIVSRKLGEFYRLGWIDLKRRVVTITNPRALRRLAEGE